MKKKSLFIGFGVATTSIAIALSCVVVGQKNSLNLSKGAEDYYTITFGAADIFDVDHATSGSEVEEYYESGTKVIKTDQLKNDVTIGYEHMYRYDSNGTAYMQVKSKTNGPSCIYNVDCINSMVSLSFYSSRSVKVEWGWEKVDGVIQYLESKTDYGSGIKNFTFNGSTPNYFRVLSDDTIDGQLYDFQIKLSKNCIPSENPIIDNDGLRYKKSGNNLELIGFSGEEFANVVIPSQIGDNKVVSIAKEAFSDSNTITNVTIPNTVTYIGNSAFYSCDNLQHPVFETGGTENLIFGYYPFGGVTSISGTFTIPKRMANSISQYALRDMFYVDNFVFEDGYNDGSFFVDQGVLYHKSGSDKTLYVYPQAANRTTFTVPSDVTDFNEFVGIYQNNYLEQLIFKNTGNLKLGSFVVDGCTNLTDVQFNGTGAVTLEWYPFAGCTGLTSLVLPASTIAHGRAFARIGENEAHPINVFYEGTSISEWSLEGSIYNGAWYTEKGNYCSIYIYSADAQVPVDSLPEHITGSWHYVDGVPTVW